MTFRWLSLLSIILFSCGEEAKWPAVTNETKPWTRWWWHGSALTKEGITAELEAYSKAGLGGVEITPIYGVKGYEDRFVPYLSDKWMELLVYTLHEADRLGMGVDMATGTGWPFGGPWVTEEYAARNIVHKTYELSAGQVLNDKIGFVQQPYLRTVNPIDVDIKKIRQPINVNTNLQELAIDQIRFGRKLPLMAVIGYSENGNSVDLTVFVTPDGTLDWSPPAGKWKIYALFQGWHGKMVERAGPGGEGNVIDHFSKDALDHYLHKFDSAFIKHDIKSLRAFFNDSYEVDDARGAADWTPQLFEDFQQRRGYDLKKYLPALFDSSSPVNPPILYDYRLTISELLHDNFTHPWTEWASKKNKITRNQAHGSPSNILDLYASVDIPEIEGTDPLRIRMASSAGNVSGKSLVSSESATWLDEHFESDLGEIKDAVDLFMLNGVNHIFYHGTSYSPPGEQWPGWLFYAAVHLNPRNPQWEDFDALNTYITRCQSFLQSSRADNDILLYYPIADPMSKHGVEMIEHFDGIGKQFAGSKFEETAMYLIEKGYTFDFISDKQLMQIKPGTMKTIVVPACSYIPMETSVHLNSLADSGVHILMTGKPRSYAGFNNRDKIVEVSGKIIVSEDLQANLEVKRETMVDEGVKFTRRKMEDGTIIYMIKNDSLEFDDWIGLNHTGQTPLLFDPLTGIVGEAQSGDDRVRVQLAKFQTMFVVLSGKTADPFPYTELAGDVVPLNGRWTIAFETGGPVLPSVITTDTLGSWTNYGEAYADFSGTVVYTTRFRLPENGAERGWLLDLGDVRESARVVLNGKEICTLISPPFRVKIEPSMAQPDNVLEIHVSNLAANRIAYLDRNGVVWKKFYNINFPARKAENRKDGLFNASEWHSRPSGLLGPVQLLSLRDDAGK